MELKEYAEMIAEGIDGAKITQSVKNNGVELTGIVISTEGSNMAPIIYVDEMYRNGLSVEAARAQILEIYAHHWDSRPTASVNDIVSWDFAKPRLRPILIEASDVNKKMYGDVWRDASQYGFPDLIVAAKVEVDDSRETGFATIRADSAIIKHWDKTADQVIDAALENMDEPVVMSMHDAFAEIAGEEAAKAMDVEGGPLMMVVTNEVRCLGAICVLNARETLQTVYPEGYIVIPSSIHEVIVMPSVSDKDRIDSMVCEVNETVVSDEEVLGRRSYVFA